ncbi:MAG TPA: riboflavin synthase [Chthoniobacteraceae bacterium]|nr:riboflavin synthase [Chthoniobacteraceae bacterium]
MFTGLVEETARVLSLEPSGEGGARRLRVAASRTVEGTAIGDSIAVNGCCLTVTNIDGGALGFDLLAETLARTSLGELAPGSRRSLVNLERALPVNGRLGGHFVQGHVDAAAEVLAVEPEGKGGDYRVSVALPPEFAHYVVFKGSIAIDGVSLTVAAVGGDSFSICLIPHTLSATHLHQLRAGDRVNLEFDLLAKYVERLMARPRT